MDKIKHTKKWLLLPKTFVNVYQYTKSPYLLVNLYNCKQQSSQKKKRDIVGIAAGTKDGEIIAIIEKSLIWSRKLHLIYQEIWDWLLKNGFQK